MPERTPRSPEWRRRLTTRQRDQLTAISFLAPAAILLVAFLALPFAMAVGLSATNQRLISNPNRPTRFVGADHYADIARDFVEAGSSVAAGVRGERRAPVPTLPRAVANNLLFALLVVPTQTAMALLLAVLVNQRLRFVNAFRTVYFVPVVVPMVVVAVVWTFLYNPGEGTINALLLALSGGRLGPYDWLGSTTLAFPAIMVLSVWQGVGFQMVIYLAGLQEIPDELYEAAAIDGCGRWDAFRYVTFPMLRNTTIFVVVSTTILAFRLFTQVDVMTQGGPQDSTMTTVLHIVNTGFRNQRIGEASAMTVVFFVMVLAISLAQRRYLREERTVRE